MCVAVCGAKMACPRCQSKPVLKPEIGAGPDCCSLIHETTMAVMFKLHHVSGCHSLIRSLTTDKGFGCGMKRGK